MGRLVSLIGRGLGWPVRRVLDVRARWVIAVIDERFGVQDGARPGLHQRLDDLDRAGRETLEALGWAEAAQGRRHGAVAELTPQAAAYLNWAAGPEGYAAQAGLWFNPPAPVEHHPGAVDLLLVNERIVEQPFVFAALGRLAPASRVLDVGGAESTVALSLAALGHRVTVVDPRPVPVAHPGIAHRQCTLEELGEGERFDAVVALSAIEHFGLGHYGAAGPDDAARLDLRAMEQMGRLLEPGGFLVLTVPFGAASVDDFQRIYDTAGLDELLAGWERERLTTVGRTGRTTWEAGAASADGYHGVALVVAQPR